MPKCLRYIVTVVLLLFSVNRAHADILDNFHFEVFSLHLCFHSVDFFLRPYLAYRN